MKGTPAAIGRALGYVFRDDDHLRRALVHPSMLSRRDATPPLDRHSFERYEFLGDRVLGLCLASLLMERFPMASEGDLAKHFATLSSRRHAAIIAQAWGLDDWLSAQPHDWAHSPAAERMRADACEAILGAVYLDGGLEAAFSVIGRFWLDGDAMDALPPVDAKSALQEYAQGLALGLPIYELVSRQGEDHEPLFCVRVSIAAQSAEGCGTSKKDAERRAAHAMLKDLHAGSSVSTLKKGSKNQ